MIICPELEKIFLLVPRTGSGSLYREVMTKYPKSFLLYRHMEADGVPMGYDRWEKIGFVRHPYSRLWSFYNFLRKFDYNPSTIAKENSHIARVRRSVERPFDDWILNNNECFSLSHDLQEGRYHYPVLTRRHPLPDTKLSQFVYLRPDLGTKIVKYENMKEFFTELGLSLDTVRNPSGEKPKIPEMTDEVKLHMNNFFKWDYSQNCQMV